MCMGSLSGRRGRICEALVVCSTGIMMVIWQSLYRRILLDRDATSVRLLDLCEQGGAEMGEQRHICAFDLASGKHIRDGLLVV